MSTRHDAAVAPRGLAGRADAWVVQYAPSRSSMLAERDTMRESSVSAATGHGIEVFFDGTIFDLDVLAARVDLPPATSVARVILEAYRRADDRCLELLTGRFVLFIADRSKSRLLAVRDQMGFYPLFYVDTADGPLFSTSIDALLAQAGVSRTLNRVVLAEHLVHRWIDSTETFFSAVRRVPPGHALEIKGSARFLRRHWDPGVERRWTDDEALAQFETVFERAVERCLGRGKAAIFLSGGFDSVSIAATATSVAARTARPALHALSLGFPDPCDEEFVQRGVAQALGLTQDMVSMDAAVSGRGVLIPALELGASWPVPLLNLWAPGFHDLASRARRQGYDTILTGTGGDEWLNVTPTLSADLIRQGEIRQLATLIGVFQRSFNLSKTQVLRNALWTCGVRPLAGEMLDRVAPALWHRERHRKLVRSTLSWVAPDPALRREMDERAERLLLPANPGKGGFYDREMQLALNHPLVAMEYEEHFEFGRRVGASVLHPYLDPDLVSLLYGMSPSALTIGGRSKSLVRGTVARRFPNLGFERHRKIEGTSFFRRTVQREGPLAWRRNGGVPALSEMGLVNASGFEHVAKELFGGQRPRDNYRIWNVFNLESWVGARQL